MSKALSALRYLMQTSTPIPLLFGAQHFDALHPRDSKNPRVTVSRNRGEKFNLHPPLHSPFTPSLPPATKKSPPRPIRWKAQAPTRHNLTRRLCNQLLPKPPAPPTRYAWLATGLQTTSSSNRRRKDANASSPRLKLPPVFSPQWAQHDPAASQSARFVSSPQDLH